MHNKYMKVNTTITSLQMVFVMTISPEQIKWRLTFLLSFGIWQKTKGITDLKAQSSNTGAAKHVNNLCVLISNGLQFSKHKSSCPMP